MRAELIPVAGGKPIAIVRDITLVGRQPESCDIVLDKNSISKMHCLIVRTDGLLFIRDLGSTNGTKVNGQRVVRGALLPGDELAFASEKFRVEMGPGEPDLEQPDDDRAVTEEIVLPHADVVEYFGFAEPERSGFAEPERSGFAEPERSGFAETGKGGSDSDVRLLDDDDD